HLIHRNRVRKSLQVFAFFFRCGLICLQISSPAGKAHQGTPKWMIDQDGCAKQAFPAGEGGPQRRDISREIREMIDAVAVDEVHHADAPSPKRTFSCKTNQIHRQNSTRKGLSDSAPSDYSLSVVAAAGSAFFLL
ncbi:MAG: hypothetical protein II330_02170, partial [Clostridia bacterium]|nr:hypothetical protein [Clostridia bacterium]